MGSNKVLDTRFHALAKHCQDLLIASGMKRRAAKGRGETAAAYLMPHFTNKAIAARCGAPESVIFA